MLLPPVMLFFISKYLKKSKEIIIIYNVKKLDFLFVLLFGNFNI